MTPALSETQQADPAAGPHPSISLHGQEQPGAKAKATAKAVLDKGCRGGGWRDSTWRMLRHVPRALEQSL